MTNLSGVQCESSVAAAAASSRVSAFNSVSNLYETRPAAFARLSHGNQRGTGRAPAAHRPHTPSTLLEYISITRITCAFHSRSFRCLLVAHSLVRLCSVHRSQLVYGPDCNRVQTAQSVVLRAVCKCVRSGKRSAPLRAKTPHPQVEERLPKIGAESGLRLVKGHLVAISRRRLAFLAARPTSGMLAGGDRRSEPRIMPSRGAIATLGNSR